VLRYAAYVLALSGRSTQWLPPFLSALAPARSNHGARESAADLFMRSVVPHLSPTARVAAGAVVRAHIEGAPLPQQRRIGALDVAVSHDEVAVVHRRTGRTTSWRTDRLSAGGVTLCGGPHGATSRLTLSTRDLAQADALAIAAQHATGSLTSTEPAEATVASATP
jgi:hypothetical protein